MTPLPPSGLEIGALTVKPARVGRGLRFEVPRSRLGADNRVVVAELSPEELEELQAIVTEELQR